MASVADGGVQLVLMQSGKEEGEELITDKQHDACAQARTSSRTKSFPVQVWRL